MAKAQVSAETTLQLKRTFSAPRERVYRAWTQASELAQWFRPGPDYVASIAQFDLRVGGGYRFEMRHKGGNVHTAVGTYREIKAPEKIVFSWNWEKNPLVVDSLITVEFRDLGASTEVILTHENLPTVGDRDRHEQGWTGCIDQLGVYLSDSH